MLTDVIAAPGFAYPGTVTVTRTAAGTDGYGRYVQGAQTTFTLSPVGVVPGSSVLLANAEGLSAGATATLYTTTKLVKLPVPDRVSIDGEVFAVHSVEGPWVGLGTVFYVVHLARLSTPGTD